LVDSAELPNSPPFSRLRGKLSADTVSILDRAGVLLAEEGDTTRAAEILLFSLNHPGMPASYRMVAQSDLDALEAELSPEDLAAARDAAATADLEEVVEAVRRDLAR
jgi:hypothetical protein